jgi:hypothetical protein
MQRLPQEEARKAFDEVRVHELLTPMAFSTRQWRSRRLQFGVVLASARI